MFSPTEIRTLREARPDLGWTMLPASCPERIAQRIYETRARKLGLVHVPEPVEITDADRRAQAARVAAQIQADKDAEEIKQQILSGYGF